MLKLTQNSKALSPVIGSIILIAVVVAVSIAATTWMGAMSFNFMEVDELKITGCSWAPDISYADLTVKNFGTNSVTLSNIAVNDVIASDVSIVSGSSTLEAEETSVFRVTQSFTPSMKHDFVVITASATKFAYVAVAPSGSSEIWYNPAWSNRKAVTIDNTLNPDDLTDYQIQLTVEYDSGMLTDFSDLRFTANDKQTLISYWIESYVPSDSAVVWVKVPSVFASATETIYMYYANPSATSESNPDDTFDIFVDFTRDEVISYGTSSQDVDSSQWEIIDDTTLRMWGNNWKATMRTIPVAGDGSQAIRFDFKSTGVEAEINGVGVDTDNSISETQFYRIYGTQSWGLSDHYGYTGGGDWQSYAIVLDNFSGDFNRFVFTNDADSVEGNIIYYRNVRVTQYTPTTPSTEFETEETI